MFTPTNTFLSAHFSLSDALKSNTADADHINNDPSVSTVTVMTIAASHMEVVRTELENTPITVNSWYRCPELNAAVGSKPTSQHIKGEAVDFTCAHFGTPVEVCKKLIDSRDRIQYDQLILEHTWVHISFAITSGEAPRGQVLSLLSNGSYSSGLTDKEGNKL